MLEYLQSNMDIVLTQIIALICNAYCAFTNKRKNVYKVTLAFNVLCGVLGFLQGNMGLVVSYTIICVRSVLVLYKEKLGKLYNCLPIAIILAHVILGVLTWENLWSIIPIITPMATMLVHWFSDNLQHYRTLNIAANSMWLVHNMYMGSYILVIVRVYTVVLNIISVIKNRKLRNK